ncbi:hypothetical protein ACYJA9_001677 [Campylobacter upsaliensis]|uniref:hypothetical protein n=1 Tax=Campylobacter upsaliensis TaxID=28080 RepID=UPI00139C8229|nr:hypothetical protein [Campylobacter upsaliensis]EDP6868759.1 hypothetical protein [Campylobacter upsaliensis]EDP6910612.1 hypothetical protein [Campylobacter upsaliensis]EDP6920740.1 hypothetical protein [Campylobacter upsaliensis]EDP6922382.1 hypothetical protein [Campylobacter upsaliensis]EFO6607131.1 hypothetical protein [Campylobacter upsaliensis]
MLGKAYEKAPNILKIGEFNEAIREKLGLNGANIFLLKKHLAHFRPERKAK